MAHVRGLHHVTAMSGPPKANLAFWRDVLGLRFVKKTVNFDDPSVYHLYYGDEVGSPGSAMTFFPWEHLPRARRGAGEVATTELAVPEGSLEWWRGHLEGRGTATRLGERLGERRLGFDDPDGLALALVEAPLDARRPWLGEGFDADVAIRGFHGVTLAVADPQATAELLTGLLDYTAGEREGAVRRFAAADGSAARFVDLEVTGGEAQPGVGAVHHVAFAAADREAQLAVRQRLTAAGFGVTPPIDRDYFWSIYFRTPAGILFEVATNEPGFTIDEPVERLGQALKLPKQHEHLRARIERLLPELH